MEAVIKEIKGLQISDATARLIACIRTLREVYDETLDVMERIYGEDVAESVINDKLNTPYGSMVKGLQDCLMMSIDESLGKSRLKEI